MTASLLVPATDRNPSDARPAGYEQLLRMAVLLGTDCTVDPRTCCYANLRHGYLVSIRRFGRCFDGPPSFADIREWLNDIAQDIAVYQEPLYLGVWRHSVTGALCLDVNVLIDTFADAIERGIDEGQHSIFDNAGRQPVPVPAMAVTTNGDGILTQPSSVRSYERSEP